MGLGVELGVVHVWVEGRVRMRACAGCQAGAQEAWEGGVSPAAVIGPFLPVREDEVGDLRLSICSRAVAQLVRSAPLTYEPNK